LSVGLGIPAHSLEQTIYNVIIERSVGVDEVVIGTVVEDMDLLPSNIDLSAARSNWCPRLAASTRCCVRCGPFWTGTTTSWSTASRPSGYSR